MSELTMIKYIRKRFHKKHSDILIGIGDDGMVLKNGMVLSTDSFAEGIHFDLRYFSMFELGYRTISASLSDLAAMAAEPVCALISLYIPRGTKDSEIRKLYRGFSKVCKKFNCDISGGDIIASPFWGITITVVGKTNRPLLRSGAKPGDYLYTTGYLGLAETGRIVLKEGHKKELFPESIKKHLYPEPRIYEAQKLRRYLNAGIDTSDGLSTDAFHIAEESRVRVLIEKIPIHPEVKLFCKLKKISPVEFILSAGEDFELLITGREIKECSGVKLFQIGKITEGKGVYILTNNKFKRIYPTGYEHLR
ncbi:MAG: thiamine-phosphate kinase [candidate division WOR-3 bacterium]|nr:thiamine-phosphate kinase [candidate division WOR-3 bacterium]